MNPLDRIRQSDAYLEMIRARWEGKPQPHPSACCCGECVEGYFRTLSVDRFNPFDDEEPGQ